MLESRRDFFPGREPEQRVANSGKTPEVSFGGLPDREEALAWVLASIKSISPLMCEAITALMLHQSESPFLLSFNATTLCHLKILSKDGLTGEQAAGVIESLARCEIIHRKKPAPHYVISDYGFEIFNSDPVFRKTYQATLSKIHQRSAVPAVRLWPSGFMPPHAQN